MKATRQSAVTDAWIATIDTPAGGVAMADLWESFVDRCSAVAGDPAMTYFHEGQRDVFFRIFTMLPRDAQRRTMARIFHLELPAPEKRAETEEPEAA
jgi:hypothetical protein